MRDIENEIAISLLPDKLFYKPAFGGLNNFPDFPGLRPAPKAAAAA